MKPRALIVHDTFGAPGGGNAVGTWALQALRDDFDVTVLAPDSPDFGALNRAYGTSLHAADVRSAPFALPFGFVIDRLPLTLRLLRYCLLLRYARRFVRREHFDVVAGTSNELDVGEPAVQYVHFPWGYFPRPDSDLRWFHFAPLVRAYRSFVFWSCGVSHAGIANNTTLANSAWTARHFTDWYGAPARVVYPPVDAEYLPVPWQTRAESFVCAGRLSPEKRLLEIVAVLDEVRRRGHPVTLLICALRDNRAYEDAVRAAIAPHADWIALELDAPRERLLDRISHCRYGIHGMYGEHFGLAVAEMLRLGCICFAPNDGGPAEILADEALLYDTDADAIDKICAVLGDPALQLRLRADGARNAERFSAATFMAQFRDVCRSVVERSLAAAPEDARGRSRGLRSFAKRVLPARWALAAGRVYRTVYPWWKRLPGAGPNAGEIATPGGRFRVPLDAPHDDIIATMRNGAIFDNEVVAVAARYVRPGMTIVDAGANFGQMAVAFARLTGPAGHVVAIEANPDVFGYLEQNLSRNGCTNARAVFGAALSSGGGTIAFPKARFWRGRSYGSYGVDPGARRGRRVPALAIDDLDVPAPVGFLKVDTQGADLDVLRGARVLIARDRMPIVFEYEAEYDEKFATSWADYEAFIAEIGYRITERIRQNVVIEPV